MEFAFYPPSETTAITGSVTVVQPTPGLLHVTVENFPATEIVSVDNFPATQTVNGTLAVSSIIGALPAGTNTIGYIANMGFSVIGPLPSGTNALGSVTVSNFPSSTVVTQSSGSNLHVDVDNFPATQAISGTVAVSNFPATQPISGSVSISNFPSNQNVTVTNSSLAVTGTFFQTTQPVSGTVTALQGTSPWVTSGTSTVSGSVTVTQATGSNLHVDVDNFPATQAVSGTVAVSSLPSIPAGSNAIGSVSVSNFPATQPISGTVTALQGTSPWVTSGTSTVSGSVTVTQSSGANLHVDIDNFPATQPVSGTVAVSSLPSIPAGSNTIGSVSVSNFPATQPVSGTVTVTQASGSSLHVDVDNFPATQVVSGTVTANQGTPSTIANGWPVKITDGTNSATVKAASTATVATDTSLVVALSPNSSLPTGTNSIGTVTTIGKEFSVSGTISANGTVISQTGLGGYSGVTVAINGTFVGAAVFQGSNDGTNYFNIYATPLSNPSSGPVDATTTTGLYYIPLAYPFFQVVSLFYSSGTISIVATFTTGAADIPIYPATYNNQVESADIVNSSLSSGTISVSTTAVAARVGASNLSNRKLLTISPQSGIIYMGASNAVTTTTGLPLYANGIYSFSFSANVTPYLIAASAITTTIFEAA